LRKRSKRSEAYFNALAGRLDKQYCPGRSWEALGHLLLCLAEPLTIADLGAGEGMISQLLAPRARKVIAVDNSPNMVKVGAELAACNGFSNLEYRLGEMEKPPIRANSMDIAILSQALHHAARPESVVQAAYKILKKGGRILILDLNRHSFEEARELYADLWLGFGESEMESMLRQAGFRDVTVSIVARESKPPRFETILASGTRR
jgi:ArsR family transcriptional regulator